MNYELQTRSNCHFIGYDGYFGFFLWLLSQSLILTQLEYTLFLALLTTLLVLQWGVYHHFHQALCLLISNEASPVHSKDISMAVLKDFYKAQLEEINRLEQNCKALEVSNEYLNWLLNLTPNYMLVLNSDFEIVQCNQYFEKVVKESNVYLEGKKLAALNFGGVVEKLQSRELWTIEDGLRHCTFEWLHIDDEDHNQYITWYCTHDIKNEFSRDNYILLGVDISSVKESEIEMLKMKEKAEAANHAKSTFLATMSHEIRTPLNGVIGMIDLLNYEYVDNRVREMIDTVSISSGHLLSIINNILDFSKIESGNLQVESEPFNLIDILCELGSAFRLIAHEKKICLLFTVEENVPNLLVGDSVRFKQILTNLISNALKFTVSNIPWQGYVHLKIEKFDNAVNKVGLLFRVEDNGIGIALAQLHSIFQPFEQEESSTTRKFGGTGLGLTITSRLSQAMGGDIWVQSKKGFGTEFTCYLPFTEQKKRLRHYYDGSLTGTKCIIFTTNQLIFKELESAILGLSGSLDCADSVSDAVDYDHIFVLDEQLEYFDEIVKGYRDNIIVLCTSVDSIPGFERSGLSSCQVLPLDFKYLKSLVNHEVTTVQNIIETLPLDQNARVLLAEDYEINCKVILAQLSKLGISADVARDGQIAWELLQINHYDLLLTDCHMPNMDGYQLTTKIRNSNNAKLEKMNIIAITANAIKGERETCIAAGMNDYLTKPIKLEELKAKLSIYLTCHQAIRRLKNKQVSTKLFNPAKLTEIIGDDDEFRDELLQDYLDISEQTLLEINKLEHAQNYSGIGSVAHKLKSSSKGIGAELIFTLCEKIEAGITDNNTQKIKDLLSELNTAMRNLQQEISQFIN